MEKEIIRVEKETIKLEAETKKIELEQIKLRLQIHLLQQQIRPQTIIFEDQPWPSLYNVNNVNKYFRVRIIVWLYLFIILLYLLYYISVF